MSETSAIAAMAFRASANSSRITAAEPKRNRIELKRHRVRRENAAPRSYQDHVGSEGPVLARRHMTNFFERHK